MLKIYRSTDRYRLSLKSNHFLENCLATSIHFVTSDMNDMDKDDASLDGNVMILPFIKRKRFEIIKTLMPNMTFEKATVGMPWRVSSPFLETSLLLIMVAG